MVIGERPYGKCDVVPELFYVATWFFHVNYLPLMPLETRLVLGQQGNMYRVVGMRLSIKSILWAWSRTASGAVAIVAGIIAFGLWVAAPEPDDCVPAALVMAISGMYFAFAMLFPCRRMPSYERACKLAEIARLDERGWAALNVLYGRDPLDLPGQKDAWPLR